MKRCSMCRNFRMNECIMLGNMRDDFAEKCPLYRQNMLSEKCSICKRYILQYCTNNYNDIGCQNFMSYEHEYWSKNDRYYIKTMKGIVVSSSFVFCNNKSCYECRYKRICKEAYLDFLNSISKDNPNAEQIQVGLSLYKIFEESED